MGRHDFIHAEHVCGTLIADDWSRFCAAAAPRSQRDPTPPYTTTGWFGAKQMLASSQLALSSAGIAGQKVRKMVQNRAVLLAIMFR